MTPALTRRLYIIAWLMLGAIALVYFFTLFQSVRSPGTTQISASPFSAAPSKEQLPAASDPALAHALSRMSTEIGRLKDSLAAANKENAALKAHLKTLETTFGPSTASLPPPSAKAGPTDLEAEEASRAASAQKVEITLLPMPNDGFAENLSEAPLPIAGQSAAKRIQFAVELASGLKADSVEPRWNDLKTRHAKLLGQLQPRSVKTGNGAGSGRESFRLVVGPFSNAAAAARLCARLNAAGAKCQGTVFTGSPLDNIAAR